MLMTVCKHYNVKNTDTIGLKLISDFRVFKKSAKKMNAGLNKKRQDFL